MTDEEKKQLVEAVIAQLKQNGTDVSSASVVEDVNGVSYVLCYDTNGNIVRVTPSTFDGVSEIIWEQSNHIDNYIKGGVYDIKGTRWRNDGLPITNVGENATIAARLIVTVTPEGATTYRHSVGQTLILSNAEGKETKVYTRNGNRTSTDGGVTYTVTWGTWANLQENVQVQVTGENGLDNLIDNGIYSGVWVKNAAHVETFVMVVINNYAAAGQAGAPKSITQFKYSITVGGSTPIYETRVGASESDWGKWKNINASEFEDIKSKALQTNTFTVDSVYSDRVNLYMRTLDGDTRIEEIPAATEETAGVMTAEDKKEQVKKTSLVNGDIIVGQAREIHSRNGKTVTDSFLVRTTAGSGTVGDGVASLKSVGGNIVKNLVDGTFESGWRGINGSFEHIGEIAKIYATQKNGGIMYPQTSIDGHKYYGLTSMYSDDDDVYMFVSDAVSGGNGSTVTKGNWGRSSWYSTGTGGSITVRLMTKNLNAVLYAVKPHVINLTGTFGAGKEPSKEECDRLFGTMDALPQGLTVANPAEFKSIGFNQFNPDNVLESKAIVDNAIVSGDKKIAVIPCLPCKVGTGENNGYCIHGDFGEDIKVYLTPLNPMEVEGELYMHELTKDATTDTYVPQIKGYMLVEVPTTANLCAHFLWSEDKCERDSYEPYFESKVELPVIPQMSEWGLAGVSNIHGVLTQDIIDLEKMVYTKTIMRVDDLSNIPWYKGTDSLYYSEIIPSAAKATSAIYSDAPYRVGYGGDGCMTIPSQGRLYLWDSTISTVAELKTKLAGKVMYVALATPEEYPLPKVDNNYISSDYGVEQFDSVVPCNANNLYYMRSLAGETRNFLDRMYDNTAKTDAKEVADYITNGIEGNKELATNAPNLALRALYIAAGAEYNDSGADKTKTAPWGETVTHKTGHYYLNGLGDITEEEILAIFLAKPITSPNSTYLWAYSKFRTNLSQFLPDESHNLKKLLVTNTKIQVVNNGREIVCNNVASMFENCVRLHSVCPILNLGQITSPSSVHYMFENTPRLVRVKVKNLKYNLGFPSSPLLDKESVLYLIQNAAPTTEITVTLHADAYARLNPYLEENADIKSALEAQPLITLASA